MFDSFSASRPIAMRLHLKFSSSAMARWFLACACASWEMRTMRRNAFQATFLVLAKKARSLARQELVGNWLWGVAYRTAKRAQADIARWHARERQVRTVMEADPVEEVMYRELRSVLDDEIKGLRKLAISVSLATLLNGCERHRR
jgi:hypothetical protein